MWGLRSSRRQDRIATATTLWCNAYDEGMRAGRGVTSFLSVDLRRHADLYVARSQRKSDANWSDVQGGILLRPFLMTLVLIAATVACASAAALLMVAVFRPSILLEFYEVNQGLLLLLACVGILILQLRIMYSLSKGPRGEPSIERIASILKIGTKELMESAGSLRSQDVTSAIRHIGESRERLVLDALGSVLSRRAAIESDVAASFSDFREQERQVARMLENASLLVADCAAVHDLVSQFYDHEHVSTVQEACDLVASASKEYIRVQSESSSEVLGPDLALTDEKVLYMFLEFYANLHFYNSERAAPPGSGFVVIRDSSRSRAMYLPDNPPTILGVITVASSEMAAAVRIVCGAGSYEFLRN